MERGFKMGEFTITQESLKAEWEDLLKKLKDHRLNNYKVECKTLHYPSKYRRVAILDFLWSVI